MQSETLPLHPKIDCWRKAYTKFGGKPKDNLSSIENLCRMTLKGGDLRPISPLVDLYNLISLKYLIPVGGEDLDKISGDIQLTFANETESPVSLLGEKDERPPHCGEVIYKDNLSAICRRWNWKEADRTKLVAQTKNCILVLEGLPPTTWEEIVLATKELADLVQKHCGGAVSSTIIDQNNQKLDF